MRFFVLVLLSLLLTACATSPGTGVRKDFSDRPVETIAVVPFYARGTFGIDPTEFAELRELYEAITVAALRDEGFEVIDPRSTRQYLENADLWEQFVDGIHLTAPLTTYFEPDPERPAIEIATLRQLAASDDFPFDVLLFGQIVYHSEGSCRIQADHYNSYAKVRFAERVPRVGARPCVSSHFQAKLVDVATGHTMWFNRMFVETHTRQIDDHLRRENIALTIRGTVAERDGLRALAPRRPAAPQTADRADQPD